MIYRKYIIGESKKCQEEKLKRFVLERKRVRASRGLAPIYIYMNNDNRLKPLRPAACLIVTYTIIEIGVHTPPIHSKPNGKEGPT